MREGACGRDTMPDINAEYHAAEGVCVREPVCV